MIVYNVWRTGAGTYMELQEAGMERYIKENNMPIKELDELYELDDYSDIVAISPDMDAASLDDGEEEELALTLYEIQDFNEVATYDIEADVDEDGMREHEVKIYKGTVEVDGITYNVYYAATGE